MADTVLSFAIPSAKVDEYVAHYVYVHKNTEMKPNPDFVSFEDTPNEPIEINVYTDKQWVREHIYRSIKAQIVRGRNAKYRDDATAYNADGVT